MRVLSEVSRLDALTDTSPVHGEATRVVPTFASAQRRRLAGRESRDSAARIAFHSTHHIAWAFILLSLSLSLSCTRGQVLGPKPPQVIISVSVTPAAAAMAPSAQRIFTASVSGAEPEVAWTVSGGSVTADGLTATFTAPSTPGTYMLVARSTEAADVSGSAEIIVSDSLAFGLAIPVTHPRLWWNPARLDAARTWLASNPQTPAADDLIAHAFVGLVGNDAAACRRAIDGVLTLDLTTAPADQAQWSGEAVTLTYDWCHAQLTPSERATLLQQWNALFGQLRGATWGGPGMPLNEVFWSRFRNELEWGVATFHESEAADGFLRSALETRWAASFLPRALSSGRGGALSTGSFSGGLMLGWASVPLVSAQLLGRDLWSETPFFTESAYAIAAATTPAPTRIDGSTSRFYELFPSNDDDWFERGGSAQRAEYGDFMSALALRSGNENVGRTARAWLNLTGAARAAHVRSVDTPTAPRPFDALATETFLAGPKWVLGRSAWGPRATAFQWQLGAIDDDAVGRVHADIGSFQLWRDGAWLSRESAAYFEFFSGYNGQGSVQANEAVAHNVLLVGGAGQVHVGAVNPPVVLRLQRHAAFVYAAVDLTPVYRYPPPGRPERDNLAVAHVERELLFLRGEEALVVLDRIQTATVGATPASAVVKTFLLHVETPPTVESPSRWISVNGDQALRINRLAPASATSRVVDERNVGQYRLEVDSSGNEHDVFLHVLQTGPAGGLPAPAALTETSTELRVTVGGAQVTFVKGATSTGGEVRVAGQTYPLRSDVQSADITADGPRWE
ncbi:MAG: hypothetical protein JNG84_02170 [Archangium sp.]|nr:hypothetical protein [Archangium sp.]